MEGSWPPPVAGHRPSVYGCEPGLTAHDTDAFSPARGCIPRCSVLPTHTHTAWLTLCHTPRDPPFWSVLLLRQIQCPDSTHTPAVSGCNGKPTRPLTVTLRSLRWHSCIPGSPGWTHTPTVSGCNGKPTRPLTVPLRSPRWHSYIPACRLRHVSVAAFIGCLRYSVAVCGAIPPMRQKVGSLRLALQASPSVHRSSRCSTVRADTHLHVGVCCMHGLASSTLLARLPSVTGSRRLPQLPLLKGGPRSPVYDRLVLK